MAEVSAAGAPLALLVAFPGCSEPVVREMKSFGGLPGGVVELRPTRESFVSEQLFYRSSPRSVWSVFSCIGKSYRLLERLISL